MNRINCLNRLSWGVLGDDLMKIWHKINAVWLVLFVLSIVYIMEHRVDAEGEVQSPQAKMTALMFMLVFYIFVWICQLIVLYFIKKRS